MDGLGATQLDLLAHHRARTLDVLLTAAAAYDGRRLRENAAGKELLALPPEMLVSVAVSAAAAAVDRRRLRHESADARGVVRLEAADAFPAEVLDALKRRHLPFGCDDIELLLDLATSTMDRERPAAHSFETMSFAVAAASRLLSAEVASATVVAALERAAQAIDALGPAPRGQASELRRRIRALAATQAPGGLLDLLVVDPRDAWAEPAKEALRMHWERWDGVQELVALMARARRTRPTETWRRQAARLARSYADLGVLLRALLEPIPRIDLTSSGMSSPPTWLLAPDNEILARGAVWATTEIDAPWVVPLLGRLALRGAAPSPHPNVTIALSLPVASGAVEALAAIGTPRAHDELRTLLAEIRRRDLLRRIAAIIGEPATETRARDERIRREKRRSVELRADPEPQERQRLATAAVRRDLGPLLRQRGFDDSAGRTFWREAGDRVETVHCRADPGGLTLELGIWFRFVPRLTVVPESEGLARPAFHACDLRGHVHAWDRDLRVAGTKAEAWFQRWRRLDALLRWLLVGSPSDTVYAQGARGSASHALLTGYVALQLGEDAVARRHLGNAAASYREHLDDGRSREPSDVGADWHAWVARVEADAALIGAAGRPAGTHRPPGRQRPPGAPPVP